MKQSVPKVLVKIIRKHELIKLGVHFLVKWHTACNYQKWPSSQIFQGFYPWEKLLYFNFVPGGPGWLFLWKTYFSEHLFYLQFYISSFIFHFVGPNSEWIFANEWFQLKQVLQSLSKNLYLDFVTSKTIWCTCNIQHTHWYKEQLILSQNFESVMFVSDTLPIVFVCLIAELVGSIHLSRYITLSLGAVIP